MCIIPKEKMDEILSVLQNGEEILTSKKANNFVFNITINNDVDKEQVGYVFNKIIEDLKCIGK